MAGFESLLCEDLGDMLNWSPPYRTLAGECKPWG